ncbi:hypothetical protein [Nostoc sp.]|uniref:hypothetical protein n=1 Tax=Nostoc sp. TaxID=1180 RepID=UPI002FFA57A3
MLRQEGIKHIERLAGKLWTDYNTHDPGITILEQFCYAITDLSYRLDFEMKDLLALSPQEKIGENRIQFFTAREILTVNPLTINDYRKLLIDINGVKNAWLEPIKNSQPAIYYDSILHTLTFQTSAITEEVNLNGLYRVMIEEEKSDKKYISDQAGLIKNIKTKLNQHRNLCEDFALIEILPIEEITVKAEIEVAAGFDVDELMAKIYIGLENFISPNLQFFTLKELLDQGKTPETIFEGFPLENGFLDDEQLDAFIKKDELHTSDLIRIILDIPGIKTVRSININSNNSSADEEWALALDPHFTPQLKDIDELTSHITFYKGHIPCNLNIVKAKSYLESLQQQNIKSTSTTQIKDIPIPLGQYRELSDYQSIQNDFPATYGIGEIGLPSSASPQRKAQAKQLQAYLMFFDQILANYFAQLENAKKLFNFQNKDKTTYYSQDIDKIPGASEILKGDRNSLADKWNDTDLERRNRFLNHLMAQYCEKFTDYSLLLYQSNIEEKLIGHKVDFLQNYPQISAGRGKAFNYNDAKEVWDTDNVSGLKKRICSLIGIPYKRQTLALANKSDEIEGFHIVEHILLRPRNSENSQQQTNFLSFDHPISEIKLSENSQKMVTCVSQQHGLLKNQQIQIFDTGNYNGMYFIKNVQQDTFDVEIEFTISETGQWIQVDQPLDPYSFQLSFVFPDWLTPFQEENFRKLIYDIINSEIPAHITAYCHWLNKSKMQDFERSYTYWLNTITDTNAKAEDIKITSNNLIKALGIGTVEIRKFSVLGYMTIGTDFVVI